jgi:hypothetical protein
MTLARLALLLPLFACACSSDGDTPENAPEAVSRPVGTFSAEAAKTEAKRLLGELKVDAESEALMAVRLDALFADAGFSKVAEKEGVSAVIALRGGGGGFLVRKGGSRGLVSFAEGRSAVPVETGTLLLGATVGGGSSVTFVVVTGLKKEERLADSYRLVAHGGMVAKLGYMSARAEAKNGGHTGWATGTGSGYGGSAGKGNAELTFLEPEADSGE